MCCTLNSLRSPLFQPVQQARWHQPVPVDPERKNGRKTKAKTNRLGARASHQFHISTGRLPPTKQMNLLYTNNFPQHTRRYPSISFLLAFFRSFFLFVNPASPLMSWHQIYRVLNIFQIRFTGRYKPRLHSLQVIKCMLLQQLLQHGHLHGSAHSSLRGIRYRSEEFTK